jgi:hypothetical protein
VFVRARAHVCVCVYREGIDYAFIVTRGTSAKLLDGSAAVDVMAGRKCAKSARVVITSGVY